MARGKGYKLAQVVLLKQMLRRCHGVANAQRKAVATAKSALSPKTWRYFSIVSDGEKRCRSCDLPTDVPKGHFAVYVGNNRSRFIVPTTYLAHPLFRELLQKAEEEFGFDHQMGLTIPCEEVAFEYLTSLLGRKDPCLSNLGLDKLIDVCQRGISCAA